MVKGIVVHKPMNGLNSHIYQCVDHGTVFAFFSIMSANRTIDNGEERMARNPQSLKLTALKMSATGMKLGEADYSSPLKDSILDNTLNRARISDLDSALAAISEAQHLISAQRRRIEYLETLSLSDEVTGLMNRRGYMQALQRELASAKRDPQAHGIVIMFDLDDFKQVNDVHGHAAGDAYLSSFAAVLANEVRPSDIVARIGGDEFAVILTRAAAKPGMARAAAIAKNINSKIMTWRQHTLQLKASYGVAAYGARDIAEAVMVSADLKLYTDKQKRKKAAVKAD